MNVYDFKKIAVFSNYSWAYMASRIAKKSFPDSTVTLITTNIEDVSKKHDFDTLVIELKDLNLRRASSFADRVQSLKRINFEAAVIDYSFNINTILLLMGIRPRKLFIIGSDETIRPLTGYGFIKTVLAKIPYFFNKALVHTSKKLRMARSLGFPTELSLETTTICNLKCRGCPTGLGQLDRPPVHISQDLFRDILEQNKVNFKYFDIIYPFIFGEPLLNRDIFDYLKKLRSASSPYTRIELHTNGNVRNPDETAREVLRTGVDMVNISLDGTSKSAYENFRKGGDFDLVCDFIRDLTKAKKESGCIRPEIVLQMIVTKYSEDQVEEFRALKEKLGADRLTYKEFFHEFTGLSDEEGYSLAPSKKEHLLDKEAKRKIIDGKKNMCGWAYRAISIMNNGNVTPCCIDFNTTLLGGLNIRKASIQKIWNSKRYRKFRKNMLDGKVSLCNKCFFS